MGNWNQTRFSLPTSQSGCAAKRSSLPRSPTAPIIDPILILYDIISWIKNINHQHSYRSVCKRAYSSAILSSPEAGGYVSNTGATGYTGYLSETTSILSATILSLPTSPSCRRGNWLLKTAFLSWIISRGTLILRSKCSAAVMVCWLTISMRVSRALSWRLRLFFAFSRDAIWS